MSDGMIALALVTFGCGLTLGVLLSAIWILITRDET
jgi:hypothetical protein